MEIVFRNFIGLMSVGAFSTNVIVEPMSRFKWNQMMMLAKTYGVDEYVSSGIIRISTIDSRLIPKDVVESAYSSCDFDKAHDEMPDAAKFLRSADAKFANFYLRRKLKSLVYNELHSIDTSTTSLAFLYLIIDNINGVIYGGINFPQIIHLGQYLRTNGDEIDFVKVDKWMSDLGIYKPANLVGSFLVSLFGFTESEIQVLKKIDSNALNKAFAPLRYTINRATNESDIIDYREKLACKLHIPDSRILGRFFYFPIEVLSKFITGVLRSLSNIEE